MWAAHPLPDREHVLVAVSPEQEGVVSAQPNWATAAPMSLVAASSGPSPVVEAVAGVLVGTTRILHDPVKRDVMYHHDVAHCQSSPSSRLDCC